MKNRALSCALLVVSALVGCGSDAKAGGSTPSDSQDGGEQSGRPDVLTFDPDMVMDEEPDDLVPGDGDGDDMPAPDDAGSPDSGPAEPSIFEDTEPTNTPNAVIEYGGPQVNSGLKLLGSHIIMPKYEGTSTNWIGRMRNDFQDTICAFVIRVRFLNQSGSELLAFDALPDLRPAADGATTTDCATAGEIFYLNGLQTVPEFELDEVYTIEWNYKLAGYLEYFTTSKLAKLEGLTVEEDSLFGYEVHGVVANQSGTTLTYPSVSAYLLNAGGQPLARLTDASDTSLFGYADWTFETNGFTEPFTTENVDMVVSYSVY